jgi:hypothetical protein
MLHWCAYTAMGYGADLDPDIAKQADRYNALARPLISHEAWEQARQQGRLNSVEQALADTQRADLPSGQEG